MISVTSKKARKKIEFGDFQTPEDLADQITKIIQKIGSQPQSILEPTCGKGAFIIASVHTFSNLDRIIGVDINQEYLYHLHKAIHSQLIKLNIELINENFFTLDWTEIINQLTEPILIIGNPPWVTNSELGKIQSFNLPKKSNFQGRNALDAVTGKSNFDISEWMILQYLEWLKNKTGTIAVLCKTAVARKILVHAWKHNYPIQDSWIYQIDALKYFHASVDACLLVINIGLNKKSKICYFLEDLLVLKPASKIGYYDEIIISDIDQYNQSKHLQGIDLNYVWRSGTKHDCSKVMELNKNAQGYCNGYKNFVFLENTYIYPLLKSSDLANERTFNCRKYILVTQKYIGEATEDIQKNAPQTWNYLKSYIQDFVKRKSSIYKNQPQFAIFGVGNYTFSPWKVAISGFYKQLKFTAIGLIQNKPVIFDDTVYFLPCYSENEANFIAEILNSEIAIMFLNSMIFWSDKRPITINLLKRLNLQALAKELGRENEYLHYTKTRLSNL